MKNQKYFRVKIGYGADDFISIEGAELSKALRAQIKGSVAVFDEGSVSGNSIISITPDWQREMGWKRGYVLIPEDYDYIGEKRIKEYRLFQEETKLAIESKLPQKNPELSEASKQLVDKFRV